MSILKIYEVGPRDGLQNEATLVSTNDKKRLVQGLIDAGLRHIELTSFVNPKNVEQMADADDVMTETLATYGRQGIEFTGLVFNQRGYDRALKTGCRSMAFGVAVSEKFSQRNTNRTTKEAFDTTRALLRQAKRDGVWSRVYLMTAWVCPFDGYMPPAQTINYAERLWAMGIDELAVADTIGYANPLDVGHLMEELGKRLDMAKLAVHLHDTQALGLANATVAIQAGVRIVDSSIGGLGGCPFAPGAAGNLATEDLAHLANKMGLGTGVDFEKLWSVVDALGGMVGRPVGGRIQKWWQSLDKADPILGFK